MKFLYGWFFGFGFFVSNLYWISISLTFDESFKFLIPLSLIFLPAFLAIFYGITTYLFLILNTYKNNKFIFNFFDNIWYLRIC